MSVQTTLRILLHSFFQRQRLIIGLSAGVLLTILLGSLIQRPSYEAASSVLILGRTYQEPLFPEPRRERPWTVLLNSKEELNSEIEIIRSRPVLERVVKSLNLDLPRQIPDEGFWGTIRTTLRAGPRLVRLSLVQMGMIQEPSAHEAFEAAVFRLGRDLKIEPSVDSQIVRILYRDPDPVLASRIVNTVTEEYLRQHLTINLNQTESSFYAEQIDHVKGELKALQEQLVNLKSSEGILSFPEQSKALLGKLQSFDVALTTVQKEIISRRSTVEKVRDLRRAQPDLLIPLPEIAQDVQIQDLENKLVNLRYQLKTMQQRYTEESRQVVTARKEVEELTAQLREQVNQLLERETAALRKLEAEEQALTQTVQELEAQIKTLPPKEVALDNLEKEVEDKQGTLSVLRKKFQDSLVSQATDSRRESVKVVSLAAVPLKPVTPNLLLNLVLGLILALVFSFGAAFLVEYWDDSLKVPEDFEQYLGHPVFASVPEL
jgi:uncharacterized protein involved in exopolysaccharide biosynthesis